jgi:hypothetical protein
MKSAQEAKVKTEIKFLVNDIMEVIIKTAQESKVKTELKLLVNDMMEVTIK